MTRIIAVLALILPLIAGAAETKGGYAACASEEAFDQFTQALVRDDERGQQYLIDNHLCIITRAGIPVTVLDTSWTGVTHIRAYVGDGVLELWTNTENVVSD